MLLLHFSHLQPCIPLCFLTSLLLSLLQDSGCSEGHISVVGI